MPISQRRRQLGIVGAVGLLVVAAAGAAWLTDPDGSRPTRAAVTAEGPSDSAAKCGPVLRRSAAGAGDHIDDAPIAYPAPPSFGDHRSRWEIRAASFYDVDSRPEVAVLVHNLEHGYNILWYDETVADDHDAVARVQEIADGYASLGRVRDPATAFIAAPWTTDDGAAFPDGMHYALTHWYADPQDRTRSRADELGLTRYCADITAEIVQDWMDDYPLTDAPEGYPDLM